MGLAAHPGAAGAIEQATQHVGAEWSRLVADPPARRNGGDRPPVLRLGQDRVVASRALVAATLLDDEAQVHAAAADDVLDRLAGPHATFSMGDASRLRSSATSARECW